MSDENSVRQDHHGLGTRHKRTAFRCSTEDMSGWWPLDDYTIGDQPALSPRVLQNLRGRRALVRASRRRGSVIGVAFITWQPPERLVVTWEISADWAPDSNIKSEVEVVFVPEGPGRTRVES